MSGGNVQVIKVVPKDGEKLEDTIRRAWELYKDGIITVKGKTINVCRNTSGLFNAELQNMEDKMDLEELQKLLKEKKQLIIFRDSNGVGHILAKTESNRLTFERLKKMEQDGVRFSTKHKMKNLTLKKILNLKIFVQSKKEKDDKISFPLQDTADGTEEIIRNFGPLQIGMEKQSNPLPRYPQFDSYNKRITTFIHWPLPSVNRTDLAAAGFFFTNQEDLVRCFQCGIGLRDFSAEDDPLLKHVRHSGDCPYLLLYLGGERLADMKSHLQTTDPDYNRQLQWNNRHNAGVTTRYRHPEYQTFEARLATFRRWPSNIGQTPNQLAEAGLYYTGQGDMVRCFQCGIELKDFSAEDDPLLKHVRHSGDCPYLLLYPGGERLADMKSQLQTTDPYYNRRLQWNNQHNAGVTTRYRHPEYQTLEGRLATFRRWPSNIGQAPSQLAEAGLYYTGFEDLVRCFACDGGLRRWDPEDDPWTEHCRWFPACPYCIEQKGEQYIAFVQATLHEQELTETSGYTRANEGGQSSILNTALYNERKSTLKDMGFQEGKLQKACINLSERGITTPTIDDFLDLLLSARQGRQGQAEWLRPSTSNESPREQNRRLRGQFVCINCQENRVNALLLPCTHHKLCMECAKPLNMCPVCKRVITGKIRTYMAE